MSMQSTPSHDLTYMHTCIQDDFVGKIMIPLTTITALFVEDARDPTIEFSQFILGRENHQQVSRDACVCGYDAECMCSRTCALVPSRSCETYRDDLHVLTFARNLPDLCISRFNLFQVRRGRGEGERERARASAHVMCGPVALCSMRSHHSRAACRRYIRW